jgi:hypothetical protein
MKRITQSYRNGKTHFIAIPFQLETSKGTNSEVEAGFEWMKLRSLNQLPSQRELGRRWGWTLYKVRQFCTSMEEWYQCYASKGSITNQSQINQHFVDSPQDTGGQFSKSISNQSVINHSQSETPDTRDTTTPYKQYKYINIGVVKIRVDDEIEDNLLRYVQQSKNCQRVLSHWLSRAGTPEIIPAPDLACISSRVRAGDMEACIQVLDWCYLSQSCARARWRRDNGHISPASLFNKKVWAECLSKAKQDINKTTTTTTTTQTTQTTGRISYNDLED